MKSICLPILLIVWSTLCPAALIDLDWQSTGDRLLTFDSQTDLQWLDLTETAGLSYAQVEASLALSGSFEGFSFASSNQLAEFFLHTGIAILGQPSAVIYQPVSALLQRMGSLDPEYQGGISVGLLAPQTIGGEPVVGQFQLADPLGLAFASVNEGTRDPNIGLPFQGSFLVRPVPEPSTIALVIFGAAISLRRRTLRTHERATKAYRQPNKL